MRNVSFLTNKNQSSISPNTVGDGGWITCNHSSAALGDWYTVKCDKNYPTPITRQFSIAAYALSIGLREVQIYGYGM